ncbi:MAG: ExeA family protein, partial [Burkholderiaceae bacterium]
MYLSHYGLNQSPFGITPNPAFFYAGNKRGAILEALIYAVTHGEGIIKVTGEVGSGKTMLCRMLESMLPENVVVIYLVNPTLSREEVVYAIAGELDLATGGKRPDEVIRLLQNDLITKHVAGKQVVLLIEEAQAMPLDTLEEIRLFSNLETAHHKLLQIVLFGQPELDESLKLPRMRQLKERITHSFKVPPMDPEVIPEFLMFRMRAAGYHGPDIFTKKAIKLISAVSEGIVRRISILADKSLLAAFADNSHAIEAKHVKAAIDDSEFSNTAAANNRRNLMVAGSLSIVGLATAVIMWQAFWPQAKSSEAINAATQATSAPTAPIMVNMPTKTTVKA